MSGTRGLLGGLLGLTLLDAGLSAATNNGWLGQIPVELAKGLDYWLDRTQPLLSRPCNSSGSSFGVSAGGYGASVDPGDGSYTVKTPEGSVTRGGTIQGSPILNKPITGAAGAHQINNATGATSGLTLA